VLGPEVVAETSARYIAAYERLTGEAFQRGAYPVGERIADDLSRITVASR
jgi:hypothetical protein